MAGSLWMVGCATEKLPPQENNPPIANAGADRTVAVGDTVELDASESIDWDDDPLSFRWELLAPQGSAARLASKSNVTTSFVADVPGAYEVRLVATDGYADSPPDMVNVEAEADAENRPPVAVVGSGLNVAVGVSVTLDGSESYDPDKDTLQFEWTIDEAPAGSVARLDDPSSDTPALVPDLAGMFRVGLVVSDGELRSDAEQVEITSVAATNRAPVADAGDDQTLPTGTTATLDGTNSVDPEGAALAYIWSLLSSPQGSSATLSASDVPAPRLTPDVDGEYVVQLIVSDGELSSAPDTVQILSATGNLPPTAHAGSDQSVAVGSMVTLRGEGSNDPDGDTLSYVWLLTESPSGSSASLTGRTTPNPTFVADVVGTFVATLTVSDGESTSQADTVVITATQPRPAAKGDVVITEVMADPSALTDAEGEWFEIYNPTSKRWELEDCLIHDDDSDTHSIMGSLEIRSMSYLTFARTASPGFTPDYVYGGQFVLGNSSDEVVITCDGIEIARVAYGSTSSGVSRALLTSKIDEVANDTAANWCEGSTDYFGGDRGTPGAANENDTSCP